MLRKAAIGLIEQLSYGNINPCLGTNHIGSNIFAARLGGEKEYISAIQAKK